MLILISMKLQSTAESLCRKIGAFDNLVDFSGLSYTASEFERLPAVQQTLALRRMTLFSRYLFICFFIDSVFRSKEEKVLFIGISVFFSKVLVMVVYEKPNFLLLLFLCRVEPSHKRMLVEALQNQNEVVVPSVH